MMTNRFKSALCGHLIQKLRVKCSVMYFLCTLPRIFTGFLLYDSHIALLVKVRIARHPEQFYGGSKNPCTSCQFRLGCCFVALSLLTTTSTIPTNSFVRKHSHSSKEKSHCVSSQKATLVAFCFGRAFRRKIVHWTIFLPQY